MIERSFASSQLKRRLDDDLLNGLMEQATLSAHMHWAPQPPSQATFQKLLSYSAISYSHFCTATTTALSSTIDPFATEGFPSAASPFHTNFRKRPSQRCTGDPSAADGRA